MIDWKPAETAPKDGRVFLGCRMEWSVDRFDWMVDLVRWDSDEEDWINASVPDWYLEYDMFQYWAEFNYPVAADDLARMANEKMRLATEARAVELQRLGEYREDSEQRAIALQSPCWSAFTDWGMLDWSKR